MYYGINSAEATTLLTEWENWFAATHEEPMDFAISSEQWIAHKIHAFNAPSSGKE